MSGYIGPLPVPQGIQNKETFTATAGQTTFNTNGYTDGAFINVYLNGVRLINGTDYTATNGSDIVLTQAASVSDVLDFETFNSFSLASQQFENITLKNPTHEDTDGGRESAVSFKGEQSGGEISTLAQIQASHDGTSDDQKGDLIFKTNDGSDNDAPTERVRIDGLGNVGIGVVPKIGGSTWQHIQFGGTGNIIARHSDSTVDTIFANNYYINSSGTDSYIATGDAARMFFNDDVITFSNAGSGSADAAISWNERMRINSSGNVGIGESSPSKTLVISEDDSECVAIIKSSDTGNAGIYLGGQSDEIKAGMILDNSTNDLKFQGHNNAERMKIDASGNVYINNGVLYLDDDGSHNGIINSPASLRVNIDSDNGGTGESFTVGHNQTAINDSNVLFRVKDDGVTLVGRTAEGDSNVGVTLRPDGFMQSTRDGSLCGDMNRLSSDGAILRFQKDGNPVGTLGSVSGSYLFIGEPSAVGISFISDRVRPATDGANADNTYDFGHPTVRWDDIYATNSAIQTSDENEKQNIASLTSAEITAATAISKLFKTFKWKDKVEAKGDAARTHTGVVAQQVETAMSDAGLDAGNYAFFISTTWWETETEVAAVEADEENGIEAQEAYTRTDTYDTQEEAPEGATERNRKGIRYPELLSFIGAATEQRLTSIESRLDALEAE